MRLNLNKKWSLKWIIAMAALICLGGMPLDEAFAGKGRGSPSRGSRSRSTSKSRGSKSGSRSTGSKAGSRGNKAGRGSSKATPSKSRAQKKADRAAYDKAKASGKAFGSRKEAMNKFKTDPANQKKYGKEGSKFASEPAKRPAHIPQNYTPPGGTQTTIIYNQGGGGYGYMNALGTFMLYDALTDMNRQSYFNNQMRGQGYYYGAAPPTVMSGGAILCIFLGIGFVIVIIVVLGKQFG